MVNRYLVLLFFLSCFCSFAQKSESDRKVNFSFSKGVMVGGYVDQGAYLNFTGPAVTYNLKNSELLLGMLPSLRFKEDKSSVKNSFVVPTLGAGITYIYKSFAFQVPVYYNPKTASNNGEWKLGVGAGLNLK